MDNDCNGHVDDGNPLRLTADGEPSPETCSVDEGICELGPNVCTRREEGDGWVSTIVCTGVQTTTSCAWDTPRRTVVVVSLTAPKRFACWSRDERRPIPITRRANPRLRRARPIDPPINPTPTIAIVSQRGTGRFPFSSSVTRCASERTAF